MAKAPFIESVPSPASGYLETVHARLIGEAAVELGAGRVKKGEAIDHAVGFEILHKVGEFVRAGQPLFTIHANDPEKLKQAREAALEAHHFSHNTVEPLPLFYD
jgi:thymidine phosphorylase